MDFLPSLSIVLAFSAAAMVLAITPGPDLTLSLGRTLSDGPKAGLACMTGAYFGCLLHTMAAVLGISVLLAASPTGFWLLKIVGAVYLLWLAYQAIFHGSTFKLESEGTKQKKISLIKNFLIGVGINVLNPKVVIFFITFLPQFVSADDPHAWKKMLFLGFYFVFITFPPMVVMIFMADKFAASLKRNPKITRIIDYLFGAIFAAFAVKILTTQIR